MSTTVHYTQAAIKYEVEVREQGLVEFHVPFSPGKRVIVFVIHEEPPADPTADLVSAAASSLDFWDNPLDDEDWNNA